jgi:hypothetical protein
MCALRNSVIAVLQEAPLQEFFNIPVIISFAQQRILNRRMGRPFRPLSPASSQPRAPTELDAGRQLTFEWNAAFRDSTTTYLGVDRQSLPNDLLHPAILLSLIFRTTGFLHRQISQSLQHPVIQYDLITIFGNSQRLNGACLIVIWFCYR